MRNYTRNFYFVPEIAFSKRCGYFRIKCFGLEFGLSWASPYGDWGISIGLYGYGVCAGIKPFSLWLYRECYNDFWAATLKELKTN
mgnify:CR=1 FL=1